MSVLWPRFPAKVTRHLVPAVEPDLRYSSRNARSAARPWYVVSIKETCEAVCKISVPASNIHPEPALGSAPVSQPVTGKSTSDEGILGTQPLG